VSSYLILIPVTCPNVGCLNLKTNLEKDKKNIFTGVVIMNLLFVNYRAKK